MLDSGCCGMAGSFGFEGGHYDVSMKIGEQSLLPAVRQAPRDALVVADGFSCREQVRHATGRKPLHSAQVLQMALRQTAGRTTERFIANNGRHGRRMRAALVVGATETYALIFDKGDEAVRGLIRFAKECRLGGSHLTAIGAFSDATLGFFDRDKKEYRKIPIREQVEVLSLVGDIALKDGAPQLHAHVVVGKADGSAHGGHLLEAHVWPTLEVIVTESPKHLRRKIDEETGLALIDVEV
jgi:predicted DNA-binding protein with PD1-like motif